MASSIALPRPLVNQLLHHAQLSPDLEVCGLVGAKNGIPVSCYAVANAAATPATRFQLEPQGQIDAMRSMRDHGEQLFAIFHSHPTAPAQPSDQDAAQAAYPEALYLIISLNTKGVLELRGFQLQPQTRNFREVELLLAED